MSRLGRGQPVQPVALHGFLGNTPANGVLPPNPTVVPLNDERARRLPVLPALSISGVLGAITLPAVAPPRPVNVDRVERRRATPDPIAFNLALNVKVAPPEPLVVSLDERRRFLAQIPPEVRRGFDTGAPAVPPKPTVTPLEPRRPATGGGEISVGYPFEEAGAVPPGPYVVPIEERRWILDRLRQPTSSHGFLGNTPANGVLPPRGQNHDRADQRTRYLPQPSIVLTSGLLATAVPEAPVTVNAGTDWAAEVASWN